MLLVNFSGLFTVVIDSADSRVPACMWPDCRHPNMQRAADPPDGTIWAAPHLFQAKLLHPALVGGDRSALDTHTILLQRQQGFQAC